jgi:hypothetical protein
MQLFLFPAADLTGKHPKTVLKVLKTPANMFYSRLLK